MPAFSCDRIISALCHGAGIVAPHKHLLKSLTRAYKSLVTHNFIASTSTLSSPGDLLFLISWIAFSNSCLQFIRSPGLSL